MRKRLHTPLIGSYNYVRRITRAGSAMLGLALFAGC